MASKGKKKMMKLKGEGNHFDYGMRHYDPRIGRFFSVDPLDATFPWYTPYQFAGNKPIIATDLDGEEPEFKITQKETGLAVVKVYGDPHIRYTVVKTYEAIIQYRDEKGNTSEMATFNVTRDGFYSMGTDVDGKPFMVNRSADPQDNSKIFIIEEKENRYTNNSSAFVMSAIFSPIEEKYNKSFYENGVQKEKDPLPKSVVRSSTGMVKDGQIHEGASYVNYRGERVSAGTYGCIGIVHPTQIYGHPENLETKDQIESNVEMIRFANVLKAGIERYRKEQDLKKDVKIPVEVIMEKRDYEKTKTQVETE
jgi:RHS repeat-associated protein